MKQNKVLIVVSMLLLLVSACAPKGELVPENNETNGNENETSNEGVDNDEERNYYHSDFSVKFDEFEIYNKIVEEYEGVEVSEMELSLKNQGYIYEVEGFDSEQEIEVEYDASTGELIELEKDSLDSDKKSLAKEDLDLIENYTDKVFTDIGEKYYLKEWTLKYKHDRKIIEFEVLNDKNNEIEYKYDFDTEELLEKDQ